MPPKIDPSVQIKANLNDFMGIEIASAINNTSGGIGKKEDSANDKKNNAVTP